MTMSDFLTILTVSLAAVMILVNPVAAEETTTSSGMTGTLIWTEVVLMIVLLVIHILIHLVRRKKG